MTDNNCSLITTAGNPPSLVADLPKSGEDVAEIISECIKSKCFVFDEEGERGPAGDTYYRVMFPKTSSAYSKQELLAMIGK